MNPYDRMRNTDLNEVIKKLRSDSPSLFEEGFSEYVRHFESQVHNIATTIVHDPPYVDEVVSMFAERSLKSLRTFKGDSPGELTNWVHTMARHLAIDVSKAHTRDAYRQVPFEEYEKGLLNRQARLQELQQPSKPVRRRAHLDKYRVCDVIDSLEEDEFLQLALRYVSKKERECIELRARGYTNPQIAAKLNMLPTTVACHVSRGCKKLAECLVQYRRTPTVQDNISFT